MFKFFDEIVNQRRYILKLINLQQISFYIIKVFLTNNTECNIRICTQQELTVNALHSCFGIPYFLKKYTGKLFFWHLQIGKLFEGFKILCTNFELILEKRGKLFKGGHSSRDDTNQGNIVLFCGSLALTYIQTMAKYYCIKERGSFTWKKIAKGGVTV